MFDSILYDLLSQFYLLIVSYYIMAKKPITYIELVKVMIVKFKQDKEAGKTGDHKSAFKAAASRWKGVKDGSDTEFSQGKTDPSSIKARKKKIKAISNKHDAVEEEAGVDSPSSSIKELLKTVDVCESCKKKLLYATPSVATKKKKTSRGKGTKKPRTMKKGTRKSKKSKKVKK